MKKMLTPNERQQLIVRHRKERDGRIRDRIKAVLAYDDGYSYSEIAHILLLDDETIRRHIDEYLKEKKLSTANGGSDGKLSNKETHELTEHLQAVTYLYVKDICQYVWQTYDKYYAKFSGFTETTLGFLKALAERKIFYERELLTTFKSYTRPCSHLEV